MEKWSRRRNSDGDDEDGVVNNSGGGGSGSGRLAYVKSASFNYHQLESRDRRFAFCRQSSFERQPLSSSSSNSNSNSQSSSSIINNNHKKPFLSRTVSTIAIPPPPFDFHHHQQQLELDGVESLWTQHNLSLSHKKKKNNNNNVSLLGFLLCIYRAARSGNRVMKRLFLMISLNVAYSTAELCIGLVSGRIGLVSDAFHLSFGSGLLTFSLFAMDLSRKKPDHLYTYGYKRLQVLSAFTNALFLLFMSFSLAVEALHAFIQDESEHKHYLIISAVTNLLVNLIGVWFFRNYARVNLVYRNAEDMNYHSVCLHVLADSIRRYESLCVHILPVTISAVDLLPPLPLIKALVGLTSVILASWLLTLGVENAEVLCLGIVSVTVFMLVMPLFRASGGVLLQMAPPSIPSSALSKCLRQVNSREGVLEVSQARFWELVPGHVVGSLSLLVKKGIDERSILEYVHHMYHDLGVQNLTVQTDFA